MIAPEYFNNHIAVEGEIIVKRVPNDTGSVMVWNPTTKKISIRTHSEIISDLSLMTANTDQMITGKKAFVTSGGNYASFNNTLQIYADDGSLPSMTYSKGGSHVGQIMFNSDGFYFKNGDNNAYYNLKAKGFVKENGDNSKVLLDGGEAKNLSEFAMSSDLSHVVTTNTEQTIIADKVFKKITTSDWVIPKYLAFPDASGALPNYIGFYMWNSQWQVNWRDSANNYSYPLLDIDGTSRNATFYGNTVSPRFTTPGGNSEQWNQAYNSIGNNVTLNTDQFISGKKQFDTGFSSYDPDGLFSLNSKPLGTITPGGNKILLGYKDYGGGQYFPRIGFLNKPELIDWSAGPIGNNFVIGIDNDGLETFKIHPSGATSKTQNSTQIFEKTYQGYYDVGGHTGILAIKMPQASPDQAMFSIDINIYGYESQYLGKLNVAFYKYVSGTMIGNGSKALFDVTDNFPTLSARVGIGTDGYVSILLGEPSTFWNGYFSFEIAKVEVKYGNFTQDWSQGWSHALESSFDQYGSNIILLPTDVSATRNWVNNNDNFVKSQISNGSYNANQLDKNSITYGYNVANAPASASTHSFSILNLDTANQNFKMQLGFDMDTNEMFSRIKFAGNYGNWEKYWTTQNFNPNNFIPTSHPAYGVTSNEINDWRHFVGYLDNKNIQPAHILPQKFQIGFTSWDNNQSAPWADYIHFGGYQDSSGGSQNLIMFSKSGPGIRQFQGSPQGVSAYQSYVDYWHTDDFTSTDVQNWKNNANSIVLANEQDPNDLFAKENKFGWINGAMTGAGGINSWVGNYLSIGGNNNGHKSQLLISKNQLLFRGNYGNEDTAFNEVYHSGNTRKFIFGDNGTGTINASDTSGWTHPVKSGFYRPNSLNDWGSLLMWAEHPQTGTGTYGAGIAFDYAGTEAYLTGIHSDGSKEPNKKIWTSGNLNKNEFVNLESGKSSVSISNTDLNDLQRTGFFKGSNLGHSPTGTAEWFFITNEYHNTGWISQTATSYGTGAAGAEANRIFKRAFVGGSYWTGWYEVYTSFNLNPATFVSQSSLNTQLLPYATLAGVQTFQNTNIFNQSPVVPSGTLDEHSVNLGQLKKFAPISKKRTYFLESPVYSGGIVNRVYLPNHMVGDVTLRVNSSYHNAYAIGIIEIQFTFGINSGGAWGFECRCTQAFGAVVERMYVEQNLYFDHDKDRVYINVHKFHTANNPIFIDVEITSHGGTALTDNSVFLQEDLVTAVLDLRNKTSVEDSLDFKANKNGNNATNTWINSSNGLQNNPTIVGKMSNSGGQSNLMNATYGQIAGYINTSGIAQGNPTDDWWFRIKMLHNNASGYYGEIGVKMTGGNDSLRYKRHENGSDGGWVEVWDKKNLLPSNIDLWNLAYNYTISDILNFNDINGDWTRYQRNDGSTIDRLKMGTGIVDSRVQSNGLGGDGSANLPNSGISALNHKALPLFHSTSQLGWSSSLIFKGWTDSYKAWKIMGPADNNNKEQDFYLSQTRSDTGQWMTERKIWTSKDFSQSHIDAWNNLTNGIMLNEEFTTNSNAGLMLADNYFGGESGMVDIQQQAFVAGKTDEYYKYGSGIYGGLEGVNYHLKSKNVGIGGEADPENKVRVEGCVKATENFKSKEEQADTLFIPNGKLATLRDEIVNDESDYAIRLDPHEYEFDPSGYLEIDDRNRLIHIIGEQTKMVVNFREIYPKQQIVIYNFDKSGNSMAVQIYGKTIYNIESGFFLRLYVTKSRRVIAERQQPNDFIW